MHALPLAAASLRSEISERIIQTNGKQRWIAVRKIVDAPRATENRRKVAAAAATWSYYRFTFHFTLEETIECAETAIRQELAALR